MGRGRRSPELEQWMRTRELHACVPRTLAAYRRIAAKALRFQRRRGRPEHPARWRLEDALALKQLFRGSHWSLTVLSQFARHFGNGVISDAGVPPPPNPSHVRWLTRPQVEAVVRLTEDDPLLAFVAFLGLGQGLRRVEWKRMQRGDVDLNARRLLVRGKGRSRPKLAWVPMHPAFEHAFARYSAQRARLLEGARHSRDGFVDPPELIVHAGPGGLSPYSSSGLDLLVRRIERRLKAEGIEVHLSSHMFRRSGATLLEEALLKSPEGAPDGVYRVVQGFLRHENLATTMRYLESNPGRQLRALARFAEAVPWSDAGHFPDSHAPGGAAPPSPPSTSMESTGASARPKEEGGGRRTRGRGYPSGGEGAFRPH